MKSKMGCPDCVNLKHRYQYRKYYKDMDEFVCKKHESEKYNIYKRCFKGYFRGIGANHKQLYCPEFRWDFLKGIRHILREIFYCKIYLNLHLKYEIWKIHWNSNRNASLSAYGVEERGTIKGAIPKKYKGSIEDMKKFEKNYIKYLKSHKTRVFGDYTRAGYIKMTLYEKYLKDGINIDNVPFEWNIESKRINKKLNNEKNPIINILGELVQAFLFLCELTVIMWQMRKELLTQIKDGTIYLIKNRKFKKGFGL